MNTSSAPIQLGLEDLLGDMHYSRRCGDMGRLALLVYCEVRRWARQAGEEALAERATLLITQSPHASRAAFMAEVAELIDELEQAHARLVNQPSEVHA